LAEKAATAFGHYARMLRRDRGLSLHAVCRLLQDSFGSIDKGSLSRLERGQQELSVIKISSLSRVYGISPEVLIERMELDREVEDRGGPDTAGRTIDELLELGRQVHGGQSKKLEAYAYFRDATLLADREGPTQDNETLERLRFNLAAAARGLGKNRLALEELSRLEKTIRCKPLHPAVLERIAHCHRCLGEFDAAERNAQTAIEEALLSEDYRTAAYAYNCLANVNMARAGDPDLTIDLLSKALRAGRSATNDKSTLKPTVAFEISTLNLLAETYLKIDRDEAARRTATAARRMSIEHDVPSGRAYADLFLGRIEERLGIWDRAGARWNDASSVARKTGIKRLIFCIEFYRYRLALRRGEQSRAKAIARQLDSLLPWIPDHLPLIDEYREISAKPPRPETRQGSRGRRAGAKTRPFLRPTTSPGPDGT
jgi:transcriptional regulator with XRE-family HTH domain